MKRLTTILLILAMCANLIACSGGADKQPAIDAFNSANTAFTELANAVNADIEAYSQETIDVLNEVADSLGQCKDLLESDEELTEEKIAELITALNDVEAWVGDASKELLGTDEK